MKKHIEKVKNFIKKHRMLNKGDKLLIAVSGGRDSMVLLHILWKLKESYGVNLVVGSVDHSIRKESKKDIEFVKKFSQEKGVPFITKTADVEGLKKRKKLTIEEAAREERYRLLKEMMEEVSGNKIATAHSATDQAETFLFRILRGSGPQGLTSILPVREGYIIRPLLCLTRAEITEIAQKEKIPFVEDETNLSLNFTRNKIRQTLLPILRKDFNPKIDNLLCDLCIDMGEIGKILDWILDDECRKIFQIEKKRISFSITEIKKIPESLYPYIFLRAFKELTDGKGGLYRRHINFILSLISNKKGKKYIKLPKEVIVQRDFDKLSFKLKKSF